MSYSESQFKKAVALVKDLPPSGSIVPTTEQKLKFYAAYKQATEGDNATPKPAEGAAAINKWSAWSELKGVKEDAQSKYVKVFIEFADLAGSDGETFKKQVLSA